MGRNNPPKSHKKFFQKPIDKYVKVYYNKDTEREVDKYGKQNLLRCILQ